MLLGPAFVSLCLSLCLSVCPPLSHYQQLPETLGEWHLLTLVFVWQVCCRQADYWQFVKDIRWLSPHSALHVEKVRVKGELAHWGVAASLQGYSVERVFAP